MRAETFNVDIEISKACCQALIAAAAGPRVAFAAGFAEVPFVGNVPGASDIFAARNAALLFVLGTMVGGWATLSRFCFVGAGGSAVASVAPFGFPLVLLAWEEWLRGFAVVEGVTLWRELVREIGGRAEPLA
jgi:hypothetical protein